jgi:arylesterase / paraoxonase
VLATFMNNASESSGNRPRRRLVSKRNVLWALLLVAVAYIGHILWLAGEFKTLSPHQPGPCQRIDGIAGGEDIALAASGERAYVVAVDRRKKPSTDGAVWAVEIAGEVSETRVSVRKVTADLGFPFHPHGLDLAVVNGAARVLVVNHRSGNVFAPSEDTVEIFDVVADGNLRHRQSVRDPLLIAMNDVAATGDGFYATIDHRWPTGLLRRIEDYGRLPLSFIAWFDGKRARRVVGGLRYANGIAVSDDGSSVFVAATSDRAVFRYSRDTTTGDLKPTARFDLGTGPDNVTIAADGNIWVGAHPKMLRFLRHAGDPAVAAPSQVLRIDPADGAVTEILLNDGKELSGAAVAVPIGDRLLLGPVFDDHLLMCTLAAR